MRIAIVFSVCSWLAVISSASADDAAKLAEQLTVLKTLTANFKQEKPAETKNKVIISGKVTLARPGKLRWEVTAPDPTLLLVTPEGITLYEPELQQAIIKRNELTMGNPAILLSCSNQELVKFFTVQQLSAGKFKLVPKKSSEAVYQAVELHFSGDKLTTMIITNLLGKEEKLHFSKVKINPKIDNAVFSFKAGAKVEVIDERALKVAK